MINPDVIRICCCYFKFSGGGGAERGSVAGIVTPRLVSPGFESL